MFSTPQLSKIPEANPRWSYSPVENIEDDQWIVAKLC